MNRQLLGYALAAVVVAALPFAGVYPIFAMKVMCYALFACAFNLLLGFTGRCRSATPRSWAAPPMRPAMR